MGRKTWYEAFEARREFNLQNENTPWMEGDGVSDIEEIVPVFMRRGGSRSCSPMAVFMDPRFGKLRRSDLQLGRCSQEKNILLDEGTLGDQPRYRTDKGPLTARELYESIRKPRFQIDEPPGSTPNATTVVAGIRAAIDTAPSGEAEMAAEEHEPDAERRVIYIGDPNEWSVMALVTTASSTQAGPLRNALYRHFKREAYVGMTTTPTGLAMFELAFHLPFRALRPLRDGEQHKDSRNVSFLDFEGRESTVMVSSSYSLALAGVDIWRWIAYCLIDTHHDEFNEDRESAEGIYSEIRDIGARFSPCGNAEFNDPGPEPRLFFLRTLETRLTMVRDEWMQVVQRLQRSIAQYEQVSHPACCCCPGSGYL